VRDAFRRYRAKAEQQYDWDAACVPTALTEDLEQQRKDKVTPCIDTNYTYCKFDTSHQCVHVYERYCVYGLHSAPT
jgi:hypothetical protein